jgi:hypothetical protein
LGEQQIQVADKLSKAYARLTSLQQLLTKNLRGGFIGEQYVAEYHAALDQLEEAGYDLGDFRIPASSLRLRSTGGNYLTGEKFWGKEPEVEHGVFLMKLQAVLSYFSLTTQSPPRKIGFAGPSRN